MRHLPSSRVFVMTAVAIGTLVFSATSTARQGRADDLPLPAVEAHLKVIQPASHGKSQAVRDLPRDDRPAPDSDAPEVRPTAPTNGGGGKGNGNTDPALQTTYPNSAPPLLLASFPGIVWTGSVPPDMNLAVGDTQVVEVVNSQFIVFDKSGNVLLPASTLKSMFASLGDNVCATFGGGDPVVNYDRLAGRWVMTRFLFGPLHMCVAVSQTSDATGAYNLYDYPFAPNTADYPKMAVWSDGYYLSANTFADTGGFMGAQACAFDRANMLTGANAAVICFQGTTKQHSLLPADLDSALAPPAGSPNFFLQYDTNTLSLYKFHADFATPSNSTFTGPASISVSKFSQPCWSCVPQPSVTDELETLGDRLMYRLSYRNFGSYESLLVSHSVQVQLNGSNSQTGIRWYEIRRPNGTPQVYQQSTFSPDTTTFRWMGSIAQDRQGNMFLGFTGSNATTFPNVRYTGRLATDPLNQMQREQIVQPGFGSQSPYPGYNRDRWGDYASVAVDPVDGCTMWFATEYLSFTGYNNWTTHLVSVRFAGCS